jgi:hypothetical protein
MPEFIRIMVFDGCHIVSKEPRIIKIFIPATRIYSLQLKHCVDLKGCNSYILQTVLKNEYFTLKIETDQDTYYSHYQVKQNRIKQLDVQTKEKCSNNFLIWVKCQELEEFEITSENCPSISWKKAGYM